MPASAQHLAVPFRVAGGAAAVVEQDTVEEIEQCVSAVLRTPVGSRLDAPDFGTPDETFSQVGQPPTAAGYLDQIEEWEPRARQIGSARLAELGVVTVTIEGQDQ